MNLISKSNYVSYQQCPRQYYLDKHNPELKNVNKIFERRIEQGNEVGRLAKTLFKELKEVAYSDDKSLMINQTKTLFDDNTKNIAEASFVHKGLFCSVDILSKNNSSYNIYEVKSSTSIKKDHLEDIAFQYYVINKTRINVERAFIMYVNKEYVRNGKLNLNRFFLIKDITDKILPYVNKVSKNIKKMERLKNIPKFLPISHCNECGYYKYCYKDLPEDSITQLYNYRKKKKYINLGYESFNDILKHDPKLNEIQKRQIDYFYNNNNEIHIETENLKRFLNSWKYPLYFLDFETLDYVIPPFDRTRPNQRLPYQASLHILDKDWELIHQEILIVPPNDPRKLMCNFLTQYIKEEGSIVVYNDAFEKSVIRDLINQESEHSKKLQTIHDRVVDLLDVFRGGMVYKKEMRGSFSIKKVYPALCPDKKESYKDLEEVHDGLEAMDALESLETLNGQEKEMKKQQLLAYCKLDTLSMVEIFFKLNKYII